MFNFVLISYERLDSVGVCQVSRMTPGNWADYTASNTFL